LRNHRPFTGTLVVSTAFLFLAQPLFAAALFPKALHIVRRVDESLSGQSTTIEEYCAGNRIVTVQGNRVSVVDYDKQELTEIDHAAHTFSVTPFVDIAKARKGKATPHAESAKWQTTPAGVKASSAGRSLDTVEMVREQPNLTEKIEIGVDRQVSLSKDAIEALIGASYPNVRREQHDLVVGAAGPQRNGGGRANISSVSPGAADVYGLPAEQTMTFDVDGTRVVTHNRVVTVSNETVPPELLNIEPGAVRVESKLTLVPKELESLDQLPADKKP